MATVKTASKKPVKKAATKPRSIKKTASKVVVKRKPAAAAASKRRSIQIRKSLKQRRLVLGFEAKKLLLGAVVAIAVLAVGAVGISHLFGNSAHAGGTSTLSASLSAVGASPTNLACGINQAGYQWAVGAGTKTNSFAPGAFCRTFGVYKLIFQSDGNFVAYKGAAAIWKTSTGGKVGATGHLSFQPDGNVVIYTGAGKALWASSTTGAKSGYNMLRLTDRGFFTIGNFTYFDYTVNTEPSTEATYGNAFGAPKAFGIAPGIVVAATKTAADIAGHSISASNVDCSYQLPTTSTFDYPTVVGGSKADIRFAPGTFCRTAGAYSLVFQSDGNLTVLYNQSKIVWASNTANQANEGFLQVQADGNVVIYGNNGSAIWASNTSAQAGAIKQEIKVQSDGTFIIKGTLANGSLAYGVGSTFQSTPSAAAPSNSYTDLPQASLAIYGASAANSTNRQIGTLTYTASVCRLNAGSGQIQLQTKFVVNSVTGDVLLNQFASTPAFLPASTAGYYATIAPFDAFYTNASEATAAYPFGANANNTFNYPDKSTNPAAGTTYFLSTESFTDNGYYYHPWLNVTSSSIVGTSPNAGNGATSTAVPVSSFVACS